MPLIEGQILEDKYEVVRLLARGGIGEVYLGVNRRLDKRVAIKVLSRELANEPVLARRFEQEARVATKICSAHVADTYDLGTLATGERFIVMELLEGETLGERLERERRIDERTLATIALQLLDALEAAHRAGIVHRDLKPENVFLTRRDNRDFTKLLDFGVSKVMDTELSGPSLTLTGAVLGTPLYMSPEQARGQNVDARTDLYALGVVLYEAVLGEAPFDARNVNELLFRVAESNPTPLELRLPSVSPELAAIVRTAMAKSPRDRYASAASMREAVLEWQAALGPGFRASSPSFRDGVLLAGATHAPTPTPRPWSLSHDREEDPVSLEDIVPRRRSKKPLFAVAILAGIVALGATHPQKVRAMSAQVAQRAHELGVDANTAAPARAAASAPFITIELSPPRAGAEPPSAAPPAAPPAPASSVAASVPVSSIPAAEPTHAKPTSNGASRPSAAVDTPRTKGAPGRPKAEARTPATDEHAAENAEPVPVETKL